MMALNQWVQDLHNKVPIEPATGFLQNLPSFISAPPTKSMSEAEIRAYHESVGRELRERLRNDMVARLLQKLHYKRVIDK